jgi:hypothetical protein
MRKSVLAALILALAASFFSISCSGHSSNSKSAADDDTGGSYNDDDDNDDDDTANSKNDDVFVVGEKGTILHFDGSAWSLMNSGTAADLFSVWGSSPSNVYAFGEFVGPNNVFLHYDGAAWSNMPDLPASFFQAQLYCMWGTAADDIFFAGGKYIGGDIFGENWGSGLILHYDGGAWSEYWVYPAGLQMDTQFVGLWGASKTDVYAIANWTGGSDLDDPLCQRE